MTGLEIGLAIGLGLAVAAAVGALIWGYNWGSNDEYEYTQRYKAEAEGERLWAGRWRDEAVKQDKRRHELDLGIGRAICRIIRAHGEECDKFIARGFLRALNILEEETGRYKEVVVEPSPAYVRALKQRRVVQQSELADHQLRQDVARLRQERDNLLLSHQHRPATAPYPTLPPLDGCKVCGSGAYTYRWGQCTFTFYSESNEETTRATVDWRKYDSNYDVGWFPVCAHHARVLDKYGTVGTCRLGHRQTGGHYREC